MVEEVKYQEHAPAPSLRPFVRLYWSLEGESAGPRSDVDRIVPDGCTEIVINRADPFRRLLDAGESKRQAEVLLVGQFESAIAIQPTGCVDLIGIRFEPSGLHALLGIPMYELSGRDQCLTHVARGLRDELVDAAGAGRLHRRTGALDAALARRLECRKSCGLAGAAVRLVEGGVPSAARLADCLGLNRRALERLFRIQIGLTPKQYLRIQRLQGVLEHLGGERPSQGWADLALQHGFTDQPHLIREFRLIARTTPERFVAERTSLAGFFEPTELSHSSNR